MVKGSVPLDATFVVFKVLVLSHSVASLREEILIIFICVISRDECREETTAGEVIWPLRKIVNFAIGVNNTEMRFCYLEYNEEHSNKVRNGRVEGHMEMMSRRSKGTTLM